MQARCELVDDSADDSDASSLADAHESETEGQSLQQLLLARWQQGPSFLRLLHRRRRLIERIVRRMHRRRTEAPVLAKVHTSAREWVQRNLRRSRIEPLHEGEEVQVARDFGVVTASVVWSNETHVEVVLAEDGGVAIVPRALVQRQHQAHGQHLSRNQAAGEALFAVGDIVTVDARTSPGMNKQGGVGRITKVNPDRTYSVRYHVTGGSERSVEEMYIHPWEGEGKRRKALGRCRVFGCASLIVDCGHVQPIDELVTKLQNLDKEKLARQRRHRAAEDGDNEERAPSVSHAEVCSLQTLNRPATQPAAKARARSKNRQPKRRQQRGDRDAWVVAQPSMETALDMADVFEDEVASEEEHEQAFAFRPDKQTDARFFAEASQPSPVRVTVHHVDLTCLPEDDRRLYKHIKRLDSDSLVAHMEEALKTLQDGTRELERLRAEATTCFRRRSVATLYMLEDRFLSLTKAIEHQGWSVFNKCLIACRKRRDLPKRIVLTRRRLNASFEQAFLTFKDNRAAVNHVLKLFHEHCARELDDGDDDGNDDLANERRAQVRMRSRQHATKNPAHQQSSNRAQKRPRPPNSNALPERTAAQPPIRPAQAACQKRSRRVLEVDDSDCSDREVVWEDRPEPVVDLTTVEDDSSHDETALPSSPPPRNPPPSAELLHAVVALRQSAAAAIANGCLDSTAAVDIAGFCRSQDVANVALCSIHTLCRALSQQDFAARTNVRRHLGVMQSCLQHLSDFKHPAAWQSCLQIIDASLTIYQQTYDSTAAPSSSEAQRRVLEGLRTQRLRLVAAGREVEDPAVRSLCRDLEKKLVAELVKTAQQAEVIQATHAAIQLGESVPMQFSHWLQFVRCYCQTDVGAQLVVSELLAPSVGGQPSVTLQRCLDVLAVFAATSHFETQLHSVADGSPKPNRFDACWKLLETVVDRVCESQSLQSLWDTSVALDAFAPPWGNVVEAAKLQWKLVTRMAELHAPPLPRLASSTLVTAAAADDEQFLCMLAPLHVTDVLSRQPLLLRIVVQCLEAGLQPAARSLISDARSNEHGGRSRATWFRDTPDPSAASRLSTAWQRLFECAASDVQRRRLAAALTRMLSAQPTETTTQQLMFLSAAAALLRTLNPEFHDGVAKLVARLLEPHTASLATGNVLQMLAVLVLYGSSRATHGSAQLICATITRQLQFVELRQDAIASQDVNAVVIWLQLGLYLAFSTNSVSSTLLAEMLAKCNVLMDHRYALDFRTVYGAVSVLEDLSGNTHLVVDSASDRDLFEWVWQRCGKNMLATLSSCLQELTSFAAVRSKYSSQLAMGVVDVCAQLFTRSYSGVPTSGKYMACYHDLWLRLRPVAGVQLSHTNIVPFIALGCRFWSVLLDSPRTATFVAAHVADVLCAWIQACFVLEMDVTRGSAPNEHVGRWSTLADSLQQFLTGSSAAFGGSPLAQLLAQSFQSDSLLPAQTQLNFVSGKERAVVGRVEWLARVCSALQQHWLDSSTQHSKIQHARQVIAQVLQGCERAITWFKGQMPTAGVQGHPNTMELFVTFASGLLASSLMRPVQHLLKPLVDQCIALQLDNLVNLDRAQLLRQLPAQAHIVCCFPFLVSILRQIPLPQRFDASIAASTRTQWDAWARPLIQYGVVCMATDCERLTARSIAATLLYSLPGSVFVVARLLGSHTPATSSRGLRLAALIMQAVQCKEDPQAVPLNMLRLHVLRQLLLQQPALLGAQAGTASAHQFAACLGMHICALLLTGDATTPTSSTIAAPIGAEDLPVLLVLTLFRLLDMAVASCPPEQLYDEADVMLRCWLLGSQRTDMRSSNEVIELRQSWLTVVKFLLLPNMPVDEARRDLLWSQASRFQAHAIELIGTSSLIAAIANVALQAHAKLYDDHRANATLAGLIGAQAKLERAIADLEGQHSSVVS